MNIPKILPEKTDTDITCVGMYECKGTLLLARNIRLDS